MVDEDADGDRRKQVVNRAHGQQPGGLVLQKGRFVLLGKDSLAALLRIVLLDQLLCFRGQGPQLDEDDREGFQRGDLVDLTMYLDCRAPGDRTLVQLG